MSSQNQKTPASLYRERLESAALKPDPVQEKAVQALQRLYEEVLARHEKPKSFWSGFPFLNAPEKHICGLYMYGGVGRGKSMLMDLFFECLPHDLPKRRVHFHEFMIGVHDYIHTRRESDGIREGVDATLPLLAARLADQARVLCFDEFHVTDVADAMILGRLFRELFERGVVIVATSNWAPDDLYKGGLQRERFLPFIALLKERAEIFHLDHGTDYRTQFLQEEGGYFSPLGAATSAKADGLFKTLTGGVPREKDVIEVKGRKIDVAQTAKGVARFTFAQLCERPHGAEDYLAIAKRYHTIFLENVPKLGYDRRNEAKRLMTLIDALYEAGTRLIVTADAPADKLYRGHDHAFEFERTISRLQEMQSQDYLAKQV